MGLIGLENEKSLFKFSTPPTIGTNKQDQKITALCLGMILLLR